MKLKINTTASFALLLSAFTSAFLLAGCSSKSAPDPQAAADAQERERLRTESQELAQVRTDHEEVQRLKKENQDLPKLRSQYQESARLKKDNQTLRQQLAKLLPKDAAAQAAAAQGANSPPHPDQASAEKAKDAALEEGALNDGDEILIDPKHLKVLLPDFDWEKLGRKDPLGVRALLERDGVQLTNTVQLKEYGLTNFVIQRAPPPTNSPAEAPRN